MELLDMPSTCPHEKRVWYSDVDGSTLVAAHPPTKGTITYSTVKKARLTEHLGNGARIHRISSSL